MQTVLMQSSASQLSIDQGPNAGFGQPHDKRPLKGMGHSSDGVRVNVDFEPQLEACVSSKYCFLPEEGSDLPAGLSCGGQ